MSVQRQKQSFLFNQEERAWSHYFEENMKDWSGYSRPILDWTVWLWPWFILYFASARAHAWMSMHVLVLSVCWVLCRKGCLQCSVSEGEEKKYLLRFLLIAFLWTLSTITSTSLCTRHVAWRCTGYAHSCTSLPHSSVTHLTALSARSTRQEAPAGLH